METAKALGVYDVRTCASVEEEEREQEEEEGADQCITLTAEPQVIAAARGRLQPSRQFPEQRPTLPPWRRGSRRPSRKAWLSTERPAPAWQRPRRGGHGGQRASRRYCCCCCLMTSAERLCAGGQKAAGQGLLQSETAPSAAAGSSGQTRRGRPTTSRQQHGTH
ncbi:hypothetical protein J3B02_003150 [Coemansia erecta]|nr:hypothetical protein J3B02_003150 [Coemansia erecta]